MQRGSHPTYQQGLGAIGRYLDQHGYEDLVLCELGDGFVGRVVLNGRLVEAIPFSVNDLNRMIRMAAEETGRLRQSPPLAPNPDGSFMRRTVGGYRDFLSALGRQCDWLEASSVLLVELPEAMLVTYRKPAGSPDASQMSNYEYLYDESGIRQLMMGNTSGLRP
ncbi:MAG: hypothetical protein JWO42_2306 [Chloroflexi bacterium]|nr:hypothetical protein [Chloroflexota bacterium]